MIEKWELSYNPTKKQKNRYILKLKSTEDDALLLPKKLNLNASIPFIDESGNFSYCIYIYDLDDTNLKKVLTELKKIQADGKFFIGKKEVVVEDILKEKVESPPVSLWQDNLLPRFTFENFVVGSNSEFVFNASKRIASNLGSIYNPFFIYGGVGLGKTHIMQSIGNFVKVNNPPKKILYTTAEKFMNEVIDNIGKGSIQQLRKSYREIDLFLVDDIQFLAQSEATQEEFFHIFNELHSGNKQIVITSDRQPRELITLENRLRSRFEWGLIVDIKPPNLETRVAILQKKTKEDGINFLNTEICIYIAQKLTSNVRELEGIIHRLKAYFEINNIQPSPEKAFELLKTELLPDESFAKPVEKIPQPVIQISPPQQIPIQPHPSPPIQTKQLPPTPIPPQPKTSQPVSVVQKEEKILEDLSLKPVPTAIFYPEGAESQLIKVKEKFLNNIKKNNLKFRLVFNIERSYDSKTKINAAFLTELCRTNKVLVAIAIAPPKSEPATVTINDLENILGVILEDIGISLEIIPSEEIEKDYKYLNLALDILLHINR